MKSIGRYVGVFGVLMGIGFALILVFSDFPQVIPSHFVKEYCSCRFVVERSSEECYREVEEYISVWGHSEDLVHKRIDAHAWFRHARAEWQSKESGCRLISSK